MFISRLHIHPQLIPEDYIVLCPLHICALHILWLITSLSPCTILKITCSFRGIPSGYVHVQICEKNEYKTYRSYGRASNTPLTSSDFLHVSQSCDTGPNGHQTCNHLCHGRTNALLKLHW